MSNSERKRIEYHQMFPVVHIIHEKEIQSRIDLSDSLSPLLLKGLLLLLGLRLSSRTWQPNRITPSGLPDTSLLFPWKGLSLTLYTVQYFSLSHIHQVSEGWIIFSWGKQSNIFNMCQTSYHFLPRVRESDPWATHILQFVHFPNLRILIP